MTRGGGVPGYETDVPTNPEQVLDRLMDAREPGSVMLRLEELEAQNAELAARARRIQLLEARLAAWQERHQHGL